MAPALAHGRFRVLWLGMGPGVLANHMVFLILGYAAFALTGSATPLGLISLSFGLPMLVLPLVGGVVADRAPRRTVLLWTQATLTLGSATLALLALGGLLELWHLFALGIVHGAAFSFNMPARQAYFGEIVGPDLLRSAVTLNNASMNFGRIAGPALAGGLLALPEGGIPTALLASAVMYAAVVLALLRTPARLPTTERARPTTHSGWEQLLEGLRYIRSSPVLLGLLTLAFAPLLFGMPFQALMPLFADRVFEAGAAGLGIMSAAVGAGALAGSVALAGFSQFPRPGALQIALGIIFGLSLAAFASSPSLGLAVAMLVIVGGSSAAYMSLNQTLVMMNTEPRLYGRVMSVYMLTFAGMPFSALPAAWLADQIGGPLTVGATGVLVVAAVTVTALLHRSAPREVAG